MKHRNLELLTIDCIPAALGIILWFCLMGLINNIEFTGTARDIYIACLAVPPAVIAGFLMILTLVLVKDHDIVDIRTPKPDTNRRQS